MKKGILIGILIALTMIATIVSAENIMVGNDATERSTPDTRSNFVVVDTNNPADHTGYLDRFYYYAKADLPFYFIVANDAWVVQWVSEEVNPVTVPGMNYFEPAVKAHVEAGWNVGLYYPQTGVVPFNYVGDDRAFFTNAGWGMPTVGQTLVFQNLEQDRTYSYVAYYEEACTTLTMVSDTSTQHDGYTTTDPVATPLDVNSYSGVGTWADSVLVSSVPGVWLNPASNPDFSGAAWISSAATTEDGIGDQWRLFKNVFNIPTGATIDSADLWFTSDNAVEAYLNTVDMGGTTNVFGAAPYPYEPSEYYFSFPYHVSLTPQVGDNTLNFVTRNWWSTSTNPTGLLYRAVVGYCVPIEVDMDGDGFNSDEDCDDTATAVYPDASDTVCNGVDNDCDILIDEDYAPDETCFLSGVCAAGNAASTCVAGQETACATGSSTGLDDNCNGVDENCNNGADEHYLPVTTSCGVGVCAAAGTTSCVSVAVIDSCTPGTPTPEVNNDLDDNCNGQTDEGFCTDQNTAKQLNETVTVYPDGTSYPTANNLISGGEYIVEASETYDYGPSIADAKCSERTGVIYGPGWVPGELLPAPWQYFLQIWLDGAHVSDNWGLTCDEADHTYATSITGDGTTIGFSIIDSGYGDNSGSLTAKIYFCNPDKDGDGLNYDVDCDDTNAAIHPGATETCNALDDDCDALIDEENVCVWECNSTKTDTAYNKLGLGVNRWVYDGGWITKKPKGGGTGPTFIPTLNDTHQCSCEQILEWLHINLPDLYGEMNGHWKYGCSQSAIQDFMRLADEIPYTVGDVGFWSPWGNVKLDFNAYEVLPATGEVNWARVTNYINSWSGPVILTDVVDASTAFFTVHVDEGTPSAVVGCDITFKVIDNGGPNTDSVQITAVVDHPGETNSCGADGQVQGPWVINAGNLVVYS